MPIYGHICRSCGTPIETTTRETGHLCSCGGTFRRDFSFRAHLPHFVPHHNWAVGKYVTSEQHFRDELKRASDDQSERTGIEHNYTPTEPSSTPPSTASDHMDLLTNRERVLHDADT